MNARFGLILAAAAMLLGGCASTPQTSVALSPDTLAASGSRIGVGMSALPKTDTHFPGADCLLCAGVAAMANTSLTTHTQKLGQEDLPKLKNQVADLIGKRGGQVTLIEEDIHLDALPSSSAKGANVAKKDFSSLRTKYNIDKLVVIN